MEDDKKADDYNGANQPTPHYLKNTGPKDPLSADMDQSRIVLYVMPDKTERPAVIVHVWEDEEETPDTQVWKGSRVNLQVFLNGMKDYNYNNPRGEVSFEGALRGMEFMEKVPYSADKEPGTWHR